MGKGRPVAVLGNIGLQVQAVQLVEYLLMRFV